MTLKINSTNSFPINKASFNISLGDYINDDSIQNTILSLIVIQNISFIAYSNSIEIFPVLTAKPMLNFVSFSLPKSLTINQLSTMSIVMNASSAISYISIETPPYYSSVKKCCVDSACTQSLISSCSFKQLNNSNNLI